MLCVCVCGRGGGGGGRANWPTFTSQLLLSLAVNSDYIDLL